jgi:uncharacterized protein (UPF0276 family)
MPRNRPLEGVALGWRPELAADLLRAPDRVDFLEVVADTCFAQRAAWREARALAEILPVVPHGVKLSLGSADGIDPARARRLGALARELEAPAITEHVALTRGGGREIGHLTPLPFTRDAVRVVARNVAAARRELPDVPLLLENVAWTLRWPEDEMPEGAFYAEVAAATGCPLLLDVANLYANALNAGVPPTRALREHPLDRVGMVHVAGGRMEHGFFMDTHGHPVPEAVFALVEEMLAVTGRVPIVLERDQGFPPFAELEGEVERLRGLLRRAPARACASVPPRVPLLEADLHGLGEMQLRQEALAVMLTDVTPPAPSTAAEYGIEAVARTRAVLLHKRVDDALPLLPRTSAAGEPARALALRAVEASPRAPRSAGIVDALRIADAAAREPALAALARRDRLELRARFAAEADGGSCAPRRGPFVGREQLPDGRRLWALKGLGAQAPVRMIERGGRG